MTRRAYAADYLGQMLAVVEAEVRKLRHDPIDLFTRIVQPALWLLIFGQVFSRVHEIPTGGVSYRDFLAPGILAQSVLFIAIFYGISTIWERDLGILAMYLVSPAPRSALVLGKSLAAGVRALAQATMVYVLALFLGIHLDHAPAALGSVVVMVVLSAAIFACFSLIVACIVKTRERFMGINQVMTMPLFFASSAIYPIAMMPPWIRTLASLNPLTYQVDALRSLMLPGYQTNFGLTYDFGVQLVVLVVLIAIADRLYPTILE
jgi:ABC-2 type transport system permease protein